MRWFKALPARLMSSTMRNLRRGVAWRSNSIKTRSVSGEVSRDCVLITPNKLTRTRPVSRIGRKVSQIDRLVFALALYQWVSWVESRSLLQGFKLRLECAEVRRGGIVLGGGFRHYDFVLKMAQKI